MEQGNEAPKPEQISNLMTPNPEFKPLKVKIIKIKGTDEQLYCTVFNLLKKSIIIEAFDLNDISNTKYLSNLSLENFQKIDIIFMQFTKIEENIFFVGRYSTRRI